MIAKFILPHLRWIVFGLLLVFALWWLYSTITAKPKAEARLGRNQTEAALDSGRDAVGAVSKQQAGETAIDKITKENERAIRNAPGADAPVDPALRDAALRSLCQRRTYSRDPKCVQFAPTR